jgi:predicted dehydrogenase
MKDGPVRLVVVGAGDFGLRHLTAARALAELEVVGVAERDDTRRAEVAAATGLPVTATLAELLDAVEPEAVLVATPPAAHLADLRLGLERGLHVLVEKPVVTNASALDELRELPQDARARVVPAHISRFLPDVAALREAVAGHAVRSVRAVRVVPRERLDLHGEVHPALSAMVHDLDLVRALVPADLVEVTSTHQWIEPHRPHPQVVAAHLRFDDGALASVENLWTLPHSRQYIDARLEVVTDVLTAHLVLPAGLRLIRADGDAVPATELEGWVHGVPTGALATQLRHFAGLVRGRHAPVVTLEDAIWSVDVALRIAAQAPSRKAAHGV